MKPNDRQFAFCYLSLIFALASGALAADGGKAAWRKVGDGIYCSAGLPTSYAIVDEGHALTIGAAIGADPAALNEHGVTHVDYCLLTHPHRDTSALVGQLLSAKIPARAAKESAALLTSEGVSAYWQSAIPLPTPGREPPLRERTFQQWVYLVHPVGFSGIDCSLEDGQKLNWRSWRLQVVATPGHTRDHLAFAARRKLENRELSAPVVFCGDALSAPGKIWAPYSTDWDHWTPEGLNASRESLRRLAALKPTALYPEHGAPIVKEVGRALLSTSDALAEAAFLKSYERYTKERVGSPLEVKLLAPEQVATAGEKPWTRLSEHLYLSGNTYVLVSREGQLLMIDPYGSTIVEQLDVLRNAQQLGRLEVAVVSHAHNDHYKGIFLLKDHHKFSVWALDRVAEPMEFPFRYRAPYLDARSVRVDRQFRHGENVDWREYKLEFVHLPGQTEFAMGLKFTVDGKRCFHTGDNFFHADQFSGSGGWSGANRGWPLPFADSARQVLEDKPDWVLMEHGGPVEFVAADFRRRVRWLGAAAEAANALSSTGNHRVDWDLQRIRVEPIRQAVKPGQIVAAKLIIANPGPRTRRLTARLDGRGIIDNVDVEVSIAAGQTGSRDLRLRLNDTAPVGRHVFPIVVSEKGVVDPADTFFVLDLAP